MSREAYIFLLYFCNYLLEFQLFRRPEFGWQVLPDIGLDLLLEVEGYIVSFVLYMRIALYICYLPWPIWKHCVTARFMLHTCICKVRSICLTCLPLNLSWLDLGLWHVLTKKLLVVSARFKCSKCLACGRNMRAALERPPLWTALSTRQTGGGRSWTVYICLFGYVWCASFNVALLLVLGTVIWFTHQIEYPSTRLHM